MKKTATFFVLFLAICLALAATSFAQSIQLKSEAASLHEIRLKSRIFTPDEQALQKSASTGETGHLLIQFDGPVTGYEIGLLQDAGVTINGWVPNNAVAAFVPEGVEFRSIPGIRWGGKLRPEDKLASTINLETAEIHVLVDVFNDVDPFEARTTLRAAGFDVISNRYLDRHTLLISTSGLNMRSLAGLDIVSYVYPASQAIIQGKPVHQCLGGMTKFGRLPNFVTNGNGWDGPGQGSFNLKYHFDNSTPDVTGEEAEVFAAFRTWSNYADISWSQTNTNNANNSIDIRWGADEHGDGFPFDGPRGTLAHGFYPDDINKETIAGDLHFDEDETWQIGSDDIENGKFELYTIALHEAGHNLGLNHSNDTDAVMFASYTAPVGDLRQDDIDGIRSIYAEKVIPRAAAPTFDPPPGTYESPIEVRVNYGPGTNFNNSQIKYTLDGSEPIAYSYSIIPDLGDYIFQRFSNTIKARTFGVNKTPSAVVEATYILIPATPTVAKPVITPNGGSYNGLVTVNISTPTELAVIRVTTDGSEPTASSFAYGGTFPVTASTTVKAKAFRTDYSPSETATADFDILIQLPSPTIYPNGGVFVGPTTVYLSSTVLGAEIRFTLNNSTPTQTSQLFTEPLTVNSNSTVSAVVFLDGFAPSAPAVAGFVIAQNVERPIIEPAGGEFTGSALVSLSSPTPGATIRYTTNGSNPTSFSTAYTTPFTLGIGSHFVKAVGFLNGANPSPIAAAGFDVYDPNATQVQTPTMKPFSSQQFVNNFQVEMDSRTEGATIRYTVGVGQLPNDPTESGGASFTYTGPFTFGQSGNTYFFKVKAFKQGLPPSAQIQSGGLAVNAALGQVDTVAISPNGGVFYNTLRITLETTTASAQIVYTDDGTIPNTTLPILPPTRTYNNSVQISKAKTITARGRRTFFLDSAPNSAEFRLKCSTPVIAPASGSFTDSVFVTLESETTGGNTKTYYTLDGSDPTEDAIEYEAPFTLLVGSHTVRAKTFRFNFEDGETAAAEYVVSLPANAPAITSHPQSQSVNPGDDVTFQVIATGVPAPGYQWLRNGVVLPSETNSTLIIPNVQLGDSGSYRAVVSNVAGVDTSAAATLSVAAIVNSVDFQLNNLPEAFGLAQNYPNPFNPTTTLRFSLPKNSPVRLEIYNLLGRKIRTLVNGTRDAGFHEAKWNGKDDHGNQMTTGVYLYRISAAQFVATRKMILMK